MSVTELNSMDELKQFIKDNQKAVVDFWADWCGPCKMLAPIFDEVSGEVEGTAFAKINIQNVQEAGQEFGISSIPCLIVFDGGQEKNRVLGLQSKENLKAKLTE